MRTRLVGIATLVALVQVGVPGFVGTASATHVGCGTVITQSTTLDSDVGPCPDNGIIVGADNIVLDLNGHRVFGTPNPGDGAGILLENRTGVTVTDGTVSDFDAGVAIIGGGTNTVSKLTARDNIGSLASDFGDGIFIDSSNNNVIEKNTVVHNGPYDGIGLFGTSSGNLIEKNVVTDNNICTTFTNPRTGMPMTICQDDGIRLEHGTTNNTVTKNEVLRNGLDGIAVFATATDNVITKNVVEGNGFHVARHRKGDGIRLFSGADRTLIEKNRVFNNAANGIIVQSRSNRILKNETGGNAAAGAPNTYDLHDTNANCDLNVWRGNTYVTAFPPCTTAP